MEMYSDGVTLERTTTRWYIRATERNGVVAVYYSRWGWVGDKRSAWRWKTEAEAQVVLDKLRKRGA